MKEPTMMVYSDTRIDGALPMKSHLFKGVYYKVVPEAAEAPEGFRKTPRAEVKKKKAAKKVSKKV